MTKDRDALIAAAAASGVSVAKIAKRLGMKPSTVFLRGKNAGVRFHSDRFWSEKELQKLRELALTDTAASAAEKLNRSEEQVRAQAAYRRISFRKIVKCT